MEEGDQVVAIAKLIEKDDEPTNGSAPGGVGSAALNPATDSTPDSLAAPDDGETPNG
jgi:hypothetical protein